jgi:hypothetical protein
MDRARRITSAALCSGRCDLEYAYYASERADHDVAARRIIASALAAIDEL